MNAPWNIVGVRPVAGWAVLLTLGLPTLARADESAVVMEMGTGGELAAIPAPHLRAGDRATAWVPRLTLSGAVRYALTNDLELGVAGGWVPPRTIYHAKVIVEDPATGAALPGTLQHTQAAWWAGATGRYYVLGLNTRIFVEAHVGYLRAMAQDATHYRVPEDGTAMAYNAKLQDQTRGGVTAGVGVGFEFTFWDFFAAGVRVDAGARLDKSVKPALLAVNYVSYAWYE